jgi:hypothetical protein
MTVTIDRLDTEVEVLPGRRSQGGGAGGPGSPAPASAQGNAELKAALRPIVLELLEEELEAYQRLRG